MVSSTRATGFRPAAAGVLLLGGVGVAAATWVGGDHGWAIGAIAAYAVLAAAAYVAAGGSSDLAALLRAGGDERQRGLDRDATAVTGLVVAAVAILGALVSIGRSGDPGVYGLFCAVGGVTYPVALWLLRRRR